jgi:hypothetical protein
MRQSDEDMAYKYEIIKNLRDGLTKLRIAYAQDFFLTTAFPEQWQSLRLREALGFELSAIYRQDLIERRFVDKSRRILRSLRRFQGD